MSNLDSLIRQDVEHGTFSSQNIFNDEYLTPQFYTYAKQLEKENVELKESIKNYVEGYEHLISTYKEQIALMRCCGNCLNRIDGQEFKDGCKVNWNCEKYNNWSFGK